MIRFRGKATEQLGLVGVIVTLGVLALLAFFVDVSELKDAVAEAGPFAPLFFILLKISTIVIAPLSGAPLYPIVGLLFGFWPGILYVLIGDVIGYSIAFFLGRKFGYPLVRKMVSGNERGLLSRIVNHIGTTKGFFHVCMTCMAVPELISYGAGISKIRYPIFISILMVFSGAISVVLVLLGASLSLSNDSLLLTIGLPLLGGAVMLVGATLFLRGLKDKEA